MIDAPRRRIALHVTKGTGRVIKFVPLGGDQRQPFQVDLEELRQASDDVRAAVEALCCLYLEAPARGPDPDRVKDALQRMALHGNSLKNLIFAFSPAAEAFAGKISAENPHITFIVNHTVPVHAPYGLLFGTPQREHFPILK